MLPAKCVHSKRKPVGPRQKPKQESPDLPVVYANSSCIFLHPFSFLCSLSWSECTTSRLGRACTQASLLDIPHRPPVGAQSSQVFS